MARYKALELVKKGNFKYGKHRIYYTIDRDKFRGKHFLFMRTGKRKLLYVDSVQPGITHTALRQYAGQYLRYIKQ